MLLICQRQVNVILEPARTVKIGEFDSSSKCKSRVGGYRVSHASTLKLTSKTRFTYVTVKLGRVSHRSQWGERIQNFKVFGLLRDC